MYSNINQLHYILHARKFHQINQFRNLTTDTSLIKTLSSRATALNLAQINLGVDSLELRIWHGLALAQPRSLIVLRYTDSSWHLTATNYWISYENKYPKEDILVLDSSFTKKLVAPLPFSDIIDSIESFRLDTFPSQHEIPGFQDNVSDGMFYIIELATSKYYKAINYNNPKFYSDPYNQKITRFLSFLQNLGVHTIY